MAEYVEYSGDEVRHLRRRSPATHRLGMIRLLTRSSVYVLFTFLHSWGRLWLRLIPANEENRPCIQPHQRPARLITASHASSLTLLKRRTNRNTSSPARSACTGRHCCGSCAANRSEEHTSELQSLMRLSYAVFCLKKKTTITKIK